MLGLAAGVKALVRVVRQYQEEVGPDDPADENAPPLPLRQVQRRRRRRRPSSSGGDGKSHSEE